MRCAGMVHLVGFELQTTKIDYFCASQHISSLLTNTWSQLALIQLRRGACAGADQRCRSSGYKRSQSIENPRVAGSIPALGTT